MNIFHRCLQIQPQDPVNALQEILDMFQACTILHHGGHPIHGYPRLILVGCASTASGRSSFCFHDGTAAPLFPIQRRPMLMADQCFSISLAFSWHLFLDKARTCSSDWLWELLPLLWHCRDLSKLQILPICGRFLWTFARRKTFQEPHELLLGHVWHDGGVLSFSMVIVI